MKYAVHMRLGEHQGKYHLLCDTLGSNLYSTADTDSMSCRRCVNRWNGIIDIAERTKGQKRWAERAKELLEILWRAKKQGRKCGLADLH